MDIIQGMNMDGLTGKVIIITGASEGIGRTGALYGTSWV